MELQLLEARVIGIAEAVIQGKPVEDDRVELKAILPSDIAKTARQIGGHANAARGEQILWIFGLDENRRRIQDPGGIDFASWWQQICSWFDGEAPAIRNHLNVAFGDAKNLTALLLDTDRAPYVVGVDGGGRVEREIPWRAGTGTRSAHRHELLTSVIQQAAVPEFEPIAGTVTLSGPDPYSGEPSKGARLTVYLTAFVSAVAEAVLPQHLQTWRVEIEGQRTIDLAPPQIWGPFRLDRDSRGPLPRKTDAGYIDVLDHSGLVLLGSGPISLRSQTNVTQEIAQAIDRCQTLAFTATLPVDRSHRAGLVNATFTRSSPDETGKGRDHLAEFKLVGEPRPDPHADRRALLETQPSEPTGPRDPNLVVGTDNP